MTYTFARRPPPSFRVGRGGGDAADGGLTVRLGTETIEVERGSFRASRLQWSHRRHLGGRDLRVPLHLVSHFVHGARLHSSVTPLRRSQRSCGLRLLARPNGLGTAAAEPPLALTPNERYSRFRTDAPGVTGQHRPGKKIRPRLQIRKRSARSRSSGRPLQGLARRRRRGPYHLLEVRSLQVLGHRSAFLCPTAACAPARGRSSAR